MPIGAVTAIEGKFAAAQLRVRTADSEADGNMDAVRLPERLVRLTGALYRPMSGGPDPPTYVLTRWVFLRLLGMIYLIAFASLGPQIAGLVGEHGILPLHDFLQSVYDNYGSRGYHLLPTLSWLNSSDAFLKTLCWGGAGASVLLIVGIATVPVLVLLWILYLSLVVSGQTFLSFQWDSLLLETGLLAVFYAPVQLLPGLAREHQPSTIARWLLWWLLFRLMFLSGVTKLLSDDPTWWNGTALNYHFETQPIPTWVGWYAHHFPDGIKVMSVGVMFFIEIVVPFLIFVPPRFRQHRHIACLLMLAFQFGIAITGNYGFFNLLTMVLCLLLLDDSVWQRLIPKSCRQWAEHVRQQPPLPIPYRIIVACAALAIVPLSSLAFLKEMERTRAQAAGVLQTPGWTDHLLEWIQPYRSINGYGLFRVMTTRRPEIVIERSDDGLHWTEYEFRWKAGDVSRAPPFVAPYMPRLDWQMWFAALNPQGSQRWLVPFLQKLAEGEPRVLKLLSRETLSEEPPRYLRLAYYDYRFSTIEAKRQHGVWWERKKIGYLTRPLSLTEHQ